MELRVSGQVASIYSGGTFQVSHDFGEDLNDGLIGVMTDYANTNFVLSMAPSNWVPQLKISTYPCSKEMVAIQQTICCLEQ